MSDPCSFDSGSCTRRARQIASEQIDPVRWFSLDHDGDQVDEDVDDGDDCDYYGDEEIGPRLLEGFGEEEAYQYLVLWHQSTNL